IGMSREPRRFVSCFAALLGAAGVIMICQASWAQQTPTRGTLPPPGKTPLPQPGKTAFPPPGKTALPQPGKAGAPPAAKSTPPVATPNDDLNTLLRLLSQDVRVGLVEYARPIDPLWIKDVRRLESSANPAVAKAARALEEPLKMREQSLELLETTKA